MKLISYLSFFKAPLLLVFVCLFFVSEVSADQCVDFASCGRQEQEEQRRQAEDRKAMEEMAEAEYQADLARQQAEDRKAMEEMAEAEYQADLARQQAEDRKAMEEMAEAEYQADLARQQAEDRKAMEEMAEAEYQADLARQQAEDRKAMEEMAETEYQADLAQQRAEEQEEQRADVNRILINACRDVKQKYPSQYWPNDCDCSQALPKETLDKCSNVARLVKNCEDRKKGLENVWDCNCQDIPGMYHGSIAMGQGAHYTEEMESHLQGCQARAKGKAEQNKPADEYTRQVANVNMTGCGDERDPRKCCSDKQAAFGIFWSYDGACSCKRISENYSHADGVLQDVRIRSSSSVTSEERENVRTETRDAREQIEGIKRDVVSCIVKSKNNCAQACHSYINGSEGCRNSISASKHCSKACDSDRLASSGSTSNNHKEFYTFMENSLLSQSRKNCLDSVKKEFKLAYKSECMDIIESIQSEKRQTLICRNGTKENPGCDSYCIDKANDVISRWNSLLETDDIVTKIFTDLAITGSSGVSGL